MKTLDVKLSNSGKNVKISDGTDNIKVKTKHFKMFILMMNFYNNLLLQDAVLPSPKINDKFIIDVRYDNAIVVYDGNLGIDEALYVIDTSIVSNKFKLFGKDESDFITFPIDSHKEILEQLTDFYYENC